MCILYIYICICVCITFLLVWVAAAPEIAVAWVPSRWAAPGGALHASPGAPCANPRGANLGEQTYPHSHHNDYLMGISWGYIYI